MKTHITHPEQFKEGVRILMRILRTKDGAVGNADRHAKKLVSRNVEEFDKNFCILASDLRVGERIYSTVDKRNISKAVRQFKQQQLDNDYNSPEILEDFYVDIYNRWVSALQQPTASAESLFLFDLDGDEVPAGIAALAQLQTEKNDEYLHGYQTKNGWHIITKPFNYTRLPQWMHPTCKKNAMMLWAY